MTVPTNDNREFYQGNGTATQFDYEFLIFAASDLRVTRTAADGTETLLTLNTDYSVSGAGDENGGSITYPISGSPLPSGETLTILRVVPITQDTDLRNQGAYYPEVVEREFDNSRMIDQQQQEELDRSLKQTEGGNNYDAGNNRITNVATPMDDADAANMGYVDGRFDSDALTKTSGHWDGQGLQARNFAYRSPLQSGDLVPFQALQQYIQDITSGNVGDASLVTALGTGDQRTLAAWMAALGYPTTSTGTQTLADALDSRTIRTESVASLEAMSISEGASVYLTQSGRAGEFVVKTGTPPSDPQKGVYINLANGNYAERQYSGSVDVGWFGAVGDGIADDTVAINAAILYASSRKLKVSVPSGSYLYGGSADLSDGVILQGAGRNATTILARDAAAPYLIKALGEGSGISHIRFEANVTQTGGRYVELIGPESFIEEFYMDGDFNGVYMTGSVSRIRHGRFQDGASGAIRIISEGGDNSQLIDDVLMGAQSPQLSSAGIRVRNSSALIISNTSVIQQGDALLIDPSQSTQDANPANGNVYSLFVNNCFFDNSGNSGIKIAPTGDASVLRCRFSNVWCGSSAQDGVIISNAGTGVVSGIAFNSLHAFLNGGAGITTGTGTIQDIEINGGTFSQNSFGAYIEGVNKLKITNATIGASSGLVGNTSAGVFLGSGVSDIVVANNIILGNGGVSISDSSTTSSKVIRDNVGYITEGGGTASVATDANGVGSIAHGLDVTPRYASAFVTGNTAQEATLLSVDGANISVRIRDTTTNSGLASGNVGVMWSATG